MRRPIALLAILLAVGAWSGALVAAPAAWSPRVSAMVYTAGALVCHQRPERSFHLAGAQLPVCARCAGLYFGAVAGAVLWIAIAGVGAGPRPRARAHVAPARMRRVLIAAAAPTLVSVASAALGWWDPSNLLRAVLAVPLGVAAAAIAAAGAAGDLR